MLIRLFSKHEHNLAHDLAPHPHFGVSGIPWKFDDPHVLAPRKDVEEHFNDYVDQMPEGFEFVSDTEFLSNKQNTDGTQTVTIKDRTTGKDIQCSFVLINVAVCIFWPRKGKVVTLSLVLCLRVQGSSWSFRRDM